MKRIKLFEEFRQSETTTQTSGPKIKEWKKKETPTEEEEEEKVEGTWKDSKGVVHIKNWKTY